MLFHQAGLGWVCEFVPAGSVRTLTAKPWPLGGPKWALAAGGPEEQEKARWTQCFGGASCRSCSLGTQACGHQDKLRTILSGGLGRAQVPTQPPTCISTSAGQRDPCGD